MIFLRRRDHILRSEEICPVVAVEGSAPMRDSIVYLGAGDDVTVRAASFNTVLGYFAHLRDALYLSYDYHASS